ncbi:hypothetical protein [Thermosipho ferrireducens]|nr:hypothetical protein [Thermosipho ferrireducens]
MTLGSLGDLTLAFEAGYYTGVILKSKGYDYYVIGSLDTLSQDDATPLNRVNASPFITAYVYELMGKGLSAAGVVPIIDGRGKIEKSIVVSLVTRKAMFPVLVENQSKKLYLENLGYKGRILIYDSLESSVERLKFFWTPIYNRQDIEKTRLEILLNSIVMISRGGDVHVKEPFVKDGILVFSDEPEIISRAYDVLKGYETAPGRIPWK